MLGKKGTFSMQLDHVNLLAYKKSLNFACACSVCKNVQNVTCIANEKKTKLELKL